MKHGVPFNLAFGTVERLESTEQLAMGIAFSEIEGAKFNLEMFDFENPKTE